MKSISTFALFLIFFSGCIPGTKKSELEFQASDKINNSIVYTREQSIDAFNKTVYPLVQSHTCLNCHNSATGGQAPIFADDDIGKAYDAITSSKKVDLANPDLSRIYVKVKTTSHNCWSGDCAADAATILAAVQEWARLTPSNSVNGLTTSSKPIPEELSLAQTEHGTILLQAEQSQWVSEVISGRFSEQQNSAAGDGKFLLFSPADISPRLAGRNLQIDGTRFTSCRDFDDAQDINNSSNRAIKIMQDRVHNPSGNVLSGTNIVNDGYLPRITSFQFNTIRPDKRLEFATMLMNRNFTNIGSVLLTDGFPITIPRTPGNALAGLSGNPLNKMTQVFANPKFAPHSTVFDSIGNFLPGSNLFPVFETPFNESISSIKNNLATAEHSPLKKFSFYKEFKDSVAAFFYTGSTPLSTATIPYGRFVNADVEALMSRDVGVTLQCPTGQATCDPTQLVFTVANSGPVLTQSNALDCYTVSNNQFQQAADNLCASGNAAYFHLIDLYVHVTVNDPAIASRSLLVSYASTSPTVHQDLETYTATATKVFLNDVARTEENPNFLYVSPGSSLALGEIVQNFNSTTYSVLRSANCISCHGATNPPAGVPQFASSSDINSYQIVKQYINYIDPTKSFRFPRTGQMAHNCTANNANDCAAVTTALANSIAAWKLANDQDAQSNGAQEFRSLTRDERLPGRVKYKFNVTEEGKYNVWAKFKNLAGANNTPGSTRINFRILQGSTGVKYSIGSAGALVNEACYAWNVGTAPDVWEWTSPGRQNELASIDQRGYILLNNDFTPKILPDNRLYFNLTPGEYTLDMIGLTENMKIDVVGLNKVTTPNLANSRLEFQPDRRAVDEKHVSDYKRRILRYDLGPMLKLSNDQQAFFEIEVKKEFGDQNYIFRNPRFITSSRDFNIYVKGIKVLINGIWNYPDATYKSFEGVVGDNRVISYAPLVSLTNDANDLISFQFEALSVSNQPLSILYPKGAPPEVIEDRRCAHLDFFVKNVKPILKDVKVMLNSEMDNYVNGFPGSPRTGRRSPQAYNCTTCHGANHPYFKMSTFTNDEEFCREALSRIDYENFYQSLIIRGINGTGNHPKFVFVEKFYKNPADANNFKVHNLGSDFNLNLHVGGNGMASNIVPGPMMIWTYQEIISHPGYAVLNSTQQAQARARAGRLKRLDKRNLSLDILNYNWYIPEVHNPIIYGQNGAINNLSAFDVAIPVGGSLDGDRTKEPVVYDVLGFVDGGLPATSTLGDMDGLIPLSAPFKTFVTNGQPGFDRANLDYNSTTTLKDGPQVMNDNWEFLRDYYREVVIDWIRRENSSRNQ